MRRIAVMAVGVVLGLAGCAPQMPASMSVDQLASDSTFQKLPEARCQVGPGNTANSSFRTQQERVGINPATGVGNASQDRFGTVGMTSGAAGQPIVSSDLFDRELVSQMEASALWGEVVRQGDAQFRLKSTILSQQIANGTATVSVHYALSDDWPSLQTVWQTDVTYGYAPVGDPAVGMQSAMRDNIAVMIRRLAVLAGSCSG